LTSKEELEEQKHNKHLSRFHKLINTIRGKADIRTRLRAVLNPEKPETSSNLTRNEVDFCTLSYFVAEEFEEFKPLKRYAEKHILFKMSEQGWGVESTIRLEQAINEAKIYRNMSVFPEKPEGSK